MSLIYSHRGFPVEVSSQQGSGSVYAVAELGDLYSERSRDESAGFEKDLEHIVQLTKVWGQTGGLFRNVLVEDIVLTPSARSFILETARALKDGAKRRISFADWNLILDRDPERRQPARWTDEERALLSWCALLSVGHLVQKWITQLSIGDLLATLYLYVGPTDLAE